MGSYGVRTNRCDTRLRTQVLQYCAAGRGRATGSENLDANFACFWGIDLRAKLLQFCRGREPGARNLDRFFDEVSTVGPLDHGLQAARKGWGEDVRGGGGWMLLRAPWSMRRASALHVIILTAELICEERHLFEA